MKTYMMGWHGFNVVDNGQATIDTLKPYVTDYNFHWIEGDYGWKFLAGVNIVNEPLAKCVAAVITSLCDQDDYIVMVGHSNGACISAMVAQRCPMVKQLLLVNPALDADWEFPTTLEAVHIYGTPGDFWTRMASYLPGSEWGSLSNGYKGSQGFVNYTDMSKDDAHPILDHSEVFSPLHRNYWLPRMIKSVVQVMRPPRLGP